MAGGLSNAGRVPAALHFEKTVGHHMSSILRKLDQPTRARAVALAAQSRHCALAAGSQLGAAPPTWGVGPMCLGALSRGRLVVRTRRSEPTKLEE